MKSSYLSIALFLLSGCGSQQMLKNTSKYVDGEIVEVCGVKEEFDWISKWQCPDGSLKKSLGRGSVGPRQNPVGNVEEEQMLDQIKTSRELELNEKDFHIIDKFTLECDDGKKEILIDMYHCK